MHIAFEQVADTNEYRITRNGTFLGSYVDASLSGRPHDITLKVYDRNRKFLGVTASIPRTVSIIDLYAKYE